MSLGNIFGIAGTALNAQLVRMNATASNLANAGTTASSEAEAFKAKRTVFKALVNENLTNAGAPYVGGVKVDRMQDDSTPIQAIYDPSNPLADAKGFNSALFNTEEMLCNMIKEFSRQLQILHPSLGENLLPNLILFNAKEESISGGFRFQK